MLVGAAISALKSIFEPDYLLAKAGVILLDLTPATQQQQDLLAPPAERDQSLLMEAMDSINAKYGRGTLHVASLADERIRSSTWRPKQQMRSPRYTTRLDEIPVVHA